MPGNPKKRRRKHRGTQTGSIDRRGRTSRPRSRQEAMAQARNQRSTKGKTKQVDRALRPPTWQSSGMRGLFFALLLFPLSVFVFGQETGGALILSVVAAVFYVPMTYYTDRFFWRRRIAKMQKAELERKAEKGRAKAARKSGGEKAKAGKD